MLEPRVVHIPSVHVPPSSHSRSRPKQLEHPHNRWLCKISLPSNRSSHRDFMFKFDFALDDADVDPELATELASVQLGDALPQEKHEEHEEPFREIPIAELLGRLPDVISYSPLVVPVLADMGTQNMIENEEKEQNYVTLARRDLFDARFQLIAQDPGSDPPTGAKPTNTDTDTDSTARALAFVEAPSDLVSGVYEGGLKTWECALDLAGYLAGAANREMRGKRVLEVGCGTAVPTMYILRELFSAPPPPLHGSSQAQTVTELHIQDYNASVLELVSFPNLILTWYMSPAAASFRAAHKPAPAANSTPASTSDHEHEHEHDYPTPDPSVPSALPLTPALHTAFLASLAAHHIVLRIFAGSWGSFDPTLAASRYDVVLTSETIYRKESMGALLGLMRGAAGVGGVGRGDHVHVCLVAAKVLYFGVGGGVEEFVARVRGAGGEVERVWEVGVGVGRRIMRVHWGGGRGVV
ncbi:hypothetical protein D9615_006175 [Tricholomella constricta]|uniref:protein-histidine N-methyltransferase n=1 Tax=Tricholomella constricta TaxID=117010 RepID=A0A8H5HB39_9AGAR|nr:hypothetical protein D9615_006175 [Tricholomella constricta]